jgi:hypothetical protein
MILHNPLPHLADPYSTQIRSPPRQMHGFQSTPRPRPRARPPSSNAVAGPSDASGTLRRRGAPPSPLPPSSPLPSWDVRRPGPAKPASKSRAGDDPFGFLAVERKLKVRKPMSLRRAAPPQPATPVEAPLVDPGYDSNDELYAEPEVFASAEPVAPRGITPASSALSSAPGTPPPKPKRTRTTGKENPPDPDPEEDDAADSDPPVRSPLAAKIPVRRSTRKPVKTKAKRAPAKKAARRKTPADASDSDSDAEADDAPRGRRDVYPATATYKVEREARRAYFREVDDYQFATEKVYVV